MGEVGIGIAGPTRQGGRRVLVALINDVLPVYARRHRSHPALRHEGGQDIAVGIHRAGQVVGANVHVPGSGPGRGPHVSPGGIVSGWAVIGSHKGPFPLIPMRTVDVEVDVGEVAVRVDGPAGQGGGVILARYVDHVFRRYRNRPGSLAPQAMTTGHQPRKANPEKSFSAPPAHSKSDDPPLRAAKISARSSMLCRLEGNSLSEISCLR